MSLSNQSQSQSMEVQSTLMEVEDSNEIPPLHKAYFQDVICACKCSVNKVREIISRHQVLQNSYAPQSKKEKKLHDRVLYLGKKKPEKSQAITCAKREEETPHAEEENESGVKGEYSSLSGKGKRQRVSHNATDLVLIKQHLQTVIKCD